MGSHCSQSHNTNNVTSGTQLVNTAAKVQWVVGRERWKYAKYRSHNRNATESEVSLRGWCGYTSKKPKALSNLYFPVMDSCVRQVAKQWRSKRKTDRNQRRYVRVAVDLERTIINIIITIDVVVFAVV